MTVREFLMRRNEYAIPVSPSSEEYFLYKHEAKEWIKHKLDTDMITDEEYLKELLMISKAESGVIYTLSGEISKRQLGEYEYI